MEFDHALLVGRIKQFYKTQKMFAVAMGMNDQHLSRLLNNKADWGASDMYKAAKLLQIEEEDFVSFFLTKLVHKR